MMCGVIAWFSLATLLANYVGSNLGITAAGVASGPISSVTINSSDNSNGIRYYFGVDTSMAFANGHSSFDIDNDGSVFDSIIVVLQGFNTLAGFDFSSII